jgi:hypothetical protein
MEGESWDHSLQAGMVQMGRSGYTIVQIQLRYHLSTQRCEILAGTDFTKVQNRLYSGSWMLLK